MTLYSDWQVDEIVLHYATGEVSEIVGDEHGLTLKLDPADFVAELTMAGYHGEHASIVGESGEKQRIKIESKDGRIVLSKD